MADHRRVHSRDPSLDFLPTGAPAPLLIPPACLARSSPSLQAVGPLPYFVLLAVHSTPPLSLRWPTTAVCTRVTRLYVSYLPEHRPLAPDPPCLPGPLLALPLGRRTPSLLFPTGSAQHPSSLFLDGRPPPCALASASLGAKGRRAPPCVPFFHPSASPARSLHAA